MLTARKKRSINLREDIVRSPGPLTVDRKNGIIKHVKILGWESSNGRKYSPAAGKSAIPLYEGAKVFFDHPDKKPTESRETRAGFGVLQHVVFEADGLYGDLHFFKSHPMAATICEDCERGIGFFGLSHNAQGEGETRNGIFHVAKITEVRSVDLVSESATTKNLWESKVKKVTRKQLLEMGYEMDGDSPAAAVTGSEDGITDHLGRAVSSIFNDPGISKDEKKKKILKLLDLTDDVAEADDDEELPEDDDVEEAEDEEDVAEADDEEDVVEDEDKEDMEEAEDEEETKESKQPKKGRGRKLLERKLRIYDECAAAKVQPTKLLVRALSGLPTTKLRKRFLTEHRAATNRPRSASGGGNHSTKLSVKEFANQLRNAD